MERVGERKGKMERYCSTDQSRQRAVASTEEEEEGIFNNASSNLRLRTVRYINLEGLKENGHILIEGRALSGRVFIGRIEENHENSLA
jgi:hypothetical protein